MEVAASFLIGVAHFLVEQHDPTSEESRQMESVQEALEAMSEDDFTCKLTVDGQTFVSSALEEDYATADDREGLPVLLYLVASFDLPDELIEQFDDDEDEFLEAATVTLTLGDLKIDRASEIEIV